MRLFVALEPPVHVVEHLDDFLDVRRDAGGAPRWSPAGQWHVTLAFMGSVPERSLDDLVERLGRAAARRSPLELTLVGGGAFPNPARAKVLYAAIDAHGREADLRHLAVGTRAAATNAGADAEGGRFHPHVTLARTGRPAEVTRWLRVLEAYRGPTWTATEVTLVESHLGEGPRRRPRYEVVGTFPLGRGNLAVTQP